MFKKSFTFTTAKSFTHNGVCLGGITGDRDAVIAHTLTSEPPICFDSKKNERTEQIRR